MCAQFILKTQANKLSLKYGIKVPENLIEIDERYLPYKNAPVVVQSQDVRKLVRMNFSIVPSWSKDPKVKFATHNARIETVLEKPTWQKPFESQHCIVPMSGFFESVYDGASAGHIIQFHKPDDELLFAAGIFDRWVNRTNEDDFFFSFSILTTEPTEFILKNGHDRSPIFLEFDHAAEWLRLKTKSQSMVDFLLSNNQKPELEVTIDRPLKAGWEKRK